MCVIASRPYPLTGLAILAAVALGMISLSTRGRASDSGGPKQILIIRHGEKPGDPSAADDAQPDPNLSVKGFERAAALSVYIPSTFPKVDFLFATKKSKHSDRPIETITPLSAAIHEEIDHHFADDDYPALAKLLLTDSKYAGKRVLICWHHGHIPELATALGVTDAPTKWPGTVFDRVWQIDYANGKATLTNLPQKLLFGDSSD
jgi:hypothetical protein